MEKQKSFAAIDFEHLTPNHETVCAVGLVVVEDGVIIQKFHSLIHPYWDERAYLNTHIHGITEKMCTNAPTFAHIMPILQKFIGARKIVAHNASTEKAVFDKACARAGIVNPYGDDDFIDTYKKSNLSLAVCCKQYGVILENHHDPLEDALACAQLYLRLQNEDLITPRESKPIRVNRDKRDSSLNIPPNLDAVVHKENPFFDKHFCVSGFPATERDSIIAFVIKELGGWNDNNVLTKTKILIGHSINCGPAKIEKARNQGCAVYNETTFITDVVEKYRLVFPPSNDQ